MRLTADATDEAVLRELGSRLRRARLARNVSQEVLANEAGVSRATVARIESGESAQLGSVIRILRVLGLIEALDQAISEPVPGPVERLRRQDRERQRASGSRRRRDQGPPAPRRSWRWGDELAG